MEAYITQQKIPDSISWRIRSFYNTRNYQFAWFSSSGLTEQARAFWNLLDYHTSYNKDTLLQDKALQKRMNRLTAEEELRVNATDKTFVKYGTGAYQLFYPLHVVYVRRRLCKTQGNGALCAAQARRCPVPGRFAAEQKAQGQ